jgi:hypothetical protein
MGAPTDQVYVTLCGTGFDAATAATTSARVNSVIAAVPLPVRNVSVQATFNGVQANLAQITIQ